jgi:hypothetical protein
MFHNFPLSPLNGILQFFASFSSCILSILLAILRKEKRRQINLATASFYPRIAEISLNEKGITADLPFKNHELHVTT